MADKARNRTIKVDYLARVEGEGRLNVRVQDGKVLEARLEIFEPPRFFEAFLRGRACSEVADITARICGICPVAYQMSALHAVEAALGLEVGGQLRALRRLLYCGEWIESHTLHVFMLHAPDFLGCESVVPLAKAHPEIVTQGLALKKAGNAIVTLLGGREIHPINVKLGGFYRLPRRDAMRALHAQLLEARSMAEAAVRWVAGFEFPDFSRDYTYVALRHPDEYPFCEGRLVSNRGLDIPISAYEQHFAERHVRHSNALYASLLEDGHELPYFVGPMARFNLNFDRLPPAVQALAEEVGLAGGCHNPFQSIVVRSLETLYAVDEALRIIEDFDPNGQACLPVKMRAGSGSGCTEAPRGILYHSYELAEDGTLNKARIIPPTSQNQWSIERDLETLVPALLELPEEDMRRRCEQAIRNYDPCISCATHFLKLNIEHEERA